MFARRNGNGSERRQMDEPPPVAYEQPPLAAYAPKPKGPHHLGNVTLKNVDQLTAMSADEIERVAEDLVRAAHETADVLRDAALRVRESGLMANERLANFVKVASACADAAKIMQQSVLHRDEPPAKPPPLEEEETRIVPSPEIAALADRIEDQ